MNKTFFVYLSRKMWGTLYPFFCTSAIGLNGVYKQTKYNGLITEEVEYKLFYILYVLLG